VKANRLSALLLFLMLSVAGAQQTNPPPSVTNGSAIEALKEKAEKGDAPAQFELAYRYGKGLGVNKDEKEAVIWFGKAADQGYALAEFALGKR